MALWLHKNEREFSSKNNDLGMIRNASDLAMKFINDDPMVKDIQAAMGK